MIKIETKHDCKSYFRKDELFDSERIREKTVSMFGFVIYRYKDSYDCNVKDTDGRLIGFNKK